MYFLSDNPVRRIEETRKPHYIICYLHRSTIFYNAIFINRREVQCKTHIIKFTMPLFINSVHFLSSYGSPPLMIRIRSFQRDKFLIKSNLETSGFGPLIKYKKDKFVEWTRLLHCLKIFLFSFTLRYIGFRVTDNTLKARVIHFVILQIQDYQ